MPIVARALLLRSRYENTVCRDEHLPGQVDPDHERLERRTLQPDDVPGLGVAIATGMQRMGGIAGLLAVVLLSGCSLLGAKASPAAPGSSALVQSPPVSSAGFATFASNPGIVGTFTPMEGATDPTQTAMYLRVQGQRLSCMKDYSAQIVLMDQATYLRSTEKRLYLAAMRFPTAEQAEALRPVSDALVQCVTSEWMKVTTTKSGTVRARGQDYPVYKTSGGADDFTFTVLIVRNLVAVVVVNSESEVPIDMMATEVYGGIMRIS